MALLIQVQGPIWPGLKPDWTKLCVGRTVERVSRHLHMSALVVTILIHLGSSQALVIFDARGRELKFWIRKRSFCGKKWKYEISMIYPSRIYPFLSIYPPKKGIAMKIRLSINHRSTHVAVNSSTDYCRWIVESVQTVVLCDQTGETYLAHWSGLKLIHLEEILHQLIGSLSHYVFTKVFYIPELVSRISSHQPYFPQFHKKAKTPNFAANPMLQANELAQIQALGDPGWQAPEAREPRSPALPTRPPLKLPQEIRGMFNGGFVHVHHPKTLTPNQLLVALIKSIKWW